MDVEQFDSEARRIVPLEQIDSLGKNMFASSERTHEVIIFI